MVVCGIYLYCFCPTCKIVRLVGCCLEMEYLRYNSSHLIFAPKPSRKGNVQITCSYWTGYRLLNFHILHTKERFSHKYWPENSDPLILPCVISSSAMVLKLGVFGFFVDHKSKNKWVHHLWVLFGVLRMFFIHAQTTVNASGIRTWQISVVLIARKNLKAPNFSPMLWWRWCRLWVLWSISMDFP